MLDPQISQIIQQNAGRLIGQDGITRHDAEAIRQELTAHVIQKLDSFDPQLGELTAFAAAVVRRRMISILRSRRAGKRDHRRITSLNVEIAVPGEAPTELANTISDRELDGRLHRHRRTDHEIRALATDLAKVVAKLPPQWQRMLQLRATHSMSQIAEELQVPRTTLNSWMSEIRRVCEVAGLNEYLY